MSEQNGPTAYRLVKVPEDRPYILVYLLDNGGAQVAAPTGALPGIGIAYMLLEMARHYVDRRATELMQVEGGRIATPSGLPLPPPPGHEL